MCIGCLINYPAVVAIQTKTFTLYLFNLFGLSSCIKLHPYSLARRLIEYNFICRYFK